MSKADKQMPLEIWTDINGHATRTQFNGGVRYIRAAEYDALREQNRVLREALDTIACGTEDKIPPYRCIDFAMAKRIAQAVLTATRQPGGEG